jgi:hypothetical protein
MAASGYIILWLPSIFRLFYMASPAFSGACSAYNIFSNCSGARGKGVGLRDMLEIESISMARNIVNTDAIGEVVFDCLSSPGEKQVL